MLKRLINTRYFIAVATGFVLLITWDVIWCAMTTFRGMSFVSTYLFALTLAMLAALPSLWMRRGWLQGTIWYLLAVWLEANLMYCRTYLTWIPPESYALAANLADFTASIGDSLRAADVLLLLIPAAGLLWLRRGKPCGRRARKTVAIAFIALIIADNCIALIYGGLRTHIRELIQACYYSTTPPVAYTLPVATLSEAFSSRPVLDAAEKQRVDSWLAEHRRRDAEYAPPPRSPRRNLVIIFCESMESWLLEQKVDGNKEITPYLNSLLKDSTTLYLPHVRSQAGSGRSIDGQLLMLAGMAPMSKQVWSMTYPRNKYHALPHALKKADPLTRATLLTSDKPITWNQILVAEAFGVDTILSRDSWKETELVGNPAKLSDGALMEQIAQRLRQGEIWPEGSPAYLHVVTYSGHNPFKLPDHLKRIKIDEEMPEKMKDYIMINNYVDHSLSRLIDYLRTRSDWKDTMVVIAGDHEALGTYRSEWLKDKGASRLLSSASEVPMIVLNSPVAGRIDDVIGQIDVYTTILDLMGLRGIADWPGMGQSALDPAKTPLDKPDAHLTELPAVSETIIRFNLLQPTDF